MSKFKKLINPTTSFRKDSLKNKSHLENTIFVIGLSKWRSYLRKYFPKNKLFFVDKDINELEFNQKYKTKFLESKGNIKVFIWGYKAPEYLLDFLKKNNLHLYFLEDGFIRSVNFGATNAPPISLCIDSLGAYFDSTKPTDLENLLQNYNFSDNEDILEKARDGIKLLVEKGISKHNTGNWIDIETIYGPKDKKRILVIGQVENDASIQFGTKSKISNYDLVKKAKEENPEAQIIYKPDPDLLSGFSETNSIDNELKNICLVTGNVPLACALESIDHLYTITSFSGMEALIRGIKVTTFGNTFYSGWGLTDDREICARRSRRLSPEELFAIVYLVYPNYFDTNTGKKIDFFETVYKISEDIEEPQTFSKTYLNNLKSSLAYKDAITYLDKKKSIEESYELLYEQAKIYFEILDFNKALSTCKEALLLEETFELVYLKAKCLRKLGNYSTDLDESYKLALKLAESNIRNEIAYEYFSYKWESVPLNQDLLKEIDNYLKYSDLENTKTTSYGKLKLLYAAMQAEIGKIISALRNKKYANSLGVKHENLMYLRYKLRQYGNIEELDDYRFDQFDKLFKNRGSFKEIVLDAGGDVCIVGNGPSIIGKHLGEEIDNHKIVVRFNSYNTDYPYCEDYGCKTDIWVRMPLNPYVKNEPQEEHKLIMFTGSNLYYREQSNWDYIFELMSMGFAVEFFEAKTFYELSKTLGRPPSAGIMLCFMLYKIIGPLKPTNFYGFSFLAEESSSYHYSDKNAKLGVRHDFSSESAFFKTLLADNDSSVKTRVLKHHALVKKNRRESKNFNHAIEKNYDLIISCDTRLTKYKFFNQKPFYIKQSEANNHIQYIKSNGKEGHESSILSKYSDKNVLIIGFGLGTKGSFARELSNKLNHDLVLVEHGFISSLGLPSETKEFYSFVVDDQGLFCDTTNPSRIENILNSEISKFSIANRERAKWLIDKIKTHNLTKYNNSGNIIFKTKPLDKNKILVVDQTANDNSIIYGQCENFTFEDMLSDALNKKNSEVYLKLHPETLAGARSGNLETIDKFKHVSNLNIIDEQCNIISLIKEVDEVFVMTSGVGLEALIVGKPVTCYGFPFYAGWGLTNDKFIAKNKRREINLEVLVYAFYITYSCYYNPENLEPCEMEDIVEWIIKNKPSYSNVFY